ncbi:MAG: type II toxin-antitoxin system VapC family toxin [bacterium]|nr:type II toxin-antitoxin system VapC family toxin [bacterium]
MRYLLDSDVIINQLRKKSSLPEVAVPSETAVSVITYAEILYGVYRSHSVKNQLKIVDDFFARGPTQILSVDSAVIHIFTLHKVKLEKAGIRLEDFDLLIAATAIAHDLILVTSNIKHFSRIPELKILK